MKDPANKWPIGIMSSWFMGGMLLSLTLFCAFILLVVCGVSTVLNAYLAWELGGVQFTIIQPAPTPAPIARAPAARAALPAPAVTPPAAAAAIPGLPTPTPHPLSDYTIAGLRARTYPGGLIRVRAVLTETGAFTRYYIDYPSDGLTITGIMQAPRQTGPFPVIILNHGYIPRDQYWSGADTASAAGYLNSRGYLTIAPDFRGWGESDTANSFFSTGQLIDVLNLISALPSLPEADFERVGMWGHSMGGGVAMKAITVDPRIKAAVLYAPVSADDAEVMAHWGPGCEPDQPYRLDNRCAGAEVLTNGLAESMFWAYADAVRNPEFLFQTSPINYVDLIAAPVQIHIGTADTRTPPAWSAAIYEALQGAGKEVEYFAYPGEGHALKGASWQLFMERVADFFERHLLSGS